MGNYVVERYEPGIKAPALRADTRRLTDAVKALQREGKDIELLGVTFMPGDEGVFERFRSEGVELVGIAHQRAAVTYERIVEAVAIDADSPAD